MELAGCTLFGKKSAVPPPPPPPSPGTYPPVDPIGTSTRDGAPATSPAGGILAGQVVDSYDRRPPATFIQVVELQGKKTDGAPIEVAADSQGYFTIQGLQPGRHYRLTARAKNGNRVLAGGVMAIPPNPKLLIRISEDLATSSTPAVPPVTTLPDAAPRPPDQSEIKPSTGSPPAAQVDPAWAPGRYVPPPSHQPDQNNQSTPPPRPDPSRTTNIPSQTPLLWTAPAFDPNAAAPPRISSAVVPSCVLTGQTLHNFALNDLNGQPWEYRTQRRGRLVLLDFWHSRCYPCLDAIRHLNIWQQSFGAYGLEVIGVAYEEGTPAERAQKVERVRQRLGITYRLLQGGDQDCPVRTQFGVLAYPTIVLLDEQGRIIWRSEGLGPDQLREVEIIIKQRLGVN
jgi:thiol-disulfide isomerase/thioredoxin